MIGIPRSDLASTLICDPRVAGALATGPLFSAGQDLSHRRIARDGKAGYISARNGPGNYGLAANLPDRDKTLFQVSIEACARPVAKRENLVDCQISGVETLLKRQCRLRICFQSHVLISSKCDQPLPVHMSMTMHAQKRFFE